jgi:hypothetical protein
MKQRRFLLKMEDSFMNFGFREFSNEIEFSLLILLFFSLFTILELYCAVVGKLFIQINFNKERVAW